MTSWSHNCHIDLIKYSITLDGTTFFFDNNSTTPISEPDQTILNKGVCFYTKQNILNIAKEKVAPQTNGIIKGIFHEINLSTPKPFTCKPYSIPLALQSKLQKEIERLKQCGFIKDSYSPHASPAFPILKRNGDLRLIIDSRRLTT